MGSLGRYILPSLHFYPPSLPYGADFLLSVQRHSTPLAFKSGSEAWSSTPANWEGARNSIYWVQKMVSIETIFCAHAQFAGVELISAAIMWLTMSNCNLLDWKSRSWLGKCLELILTVQLKFLLWSRAHMLQLRWECFFLSQDSTEHEYTTALSLIVHIQHGVNSYFHTQCCLETKKAFSTQLQHMS